VRSFEDFSLVEFFSAFETLPGPIRVDQFLRRLGAGVEFLPFVTLIVDLPIWAQLESQFWTAPKPNTRDGRRIVLSEEADGAEGMLAHLIQTLEHSSDQIAGHEDQ